VNLNPGVSQRSQPNTSGIGHYDERSGTEAVERPVSWNRTSYTLLAALVAFWAIKVYSTWGAWGNLTIDSGHEMYVPWVLSQGKVLYRDVWFNFGPAAPYFNSYLFRIFGPRLEVLYWAGSLAALGSAIFLYLSGLRLSSWILGATAGAVLLAEAFQPSLFCFPLPYSFSAVYGTLLGCLFLWLALSVVTRMDSGGTGWMVAAATTAAVALLVKPEFGAACYATLALVIAVRAYLQRSWRSIGKDVLATVPGIVLCAAVIGWMVSLAGVEFITQENLEFWPTSYFMKTFGKMWLERNGFALSLSAFGDAALDTLPIALAAAAVYFVRSLRLRIACLAGIFLGTLVESYLRAGSRLAALRWTVASFLFPRCMVLYVIIGALLAWWCFWRERSDRSKTNRNAGIALLFSFSGLLAFRVLMQMKPSEYPIYYNAPVVLSFLLLARPVLRRQSWGSMQRWIEPLFCVALVVWTADCARAFGKEARHYVPLRTDRGTIRVSPHMAEAYDAAIRFMKEKASRGESVLSLPEDTSLYFLSGSYCPTRVFEFSPGIPPGKMMDETIHEIDSKPVPYLLWSNRAFVEYPTPVFGKDFDEELGDYLRSHYRFVSPLNNTDPSREWNYVYWAAGIWERTPENKKPS
jgi:hypothetical protein